MATTANKNRSILSGLMDGPTPVTETPNARPAVDAPPPPASAAPERLTSRLSGLSRVTSGDVKEKTLHLVEPDRCRMWVRHNRRYDLLNEVACADLLESLRSQGEQEFPAIVRRVKDDPDYDFEVICGARRHWSVSYLRRVEHRPIRFLIEDRDLDDEAAFRLSDVENRSRQDICDYERAIDYRNAVEEYYGGVAARMARRMEVGEVWLSRFLELAKLPAGVVEAFGDIRQLRENHARLIKPLLMDPATRPKVMAEAKKLAAEQTRRMQAGEPILEAAKVLEAIKGAAVGKGTAPLAKPASRAVVSESGTHLFSLTPKGSKRAVIELSLDADAANADFQAAFRAALAELRPGR
ncbi:MAG: ParB/RepB/Spo0J family partition protein [Caulobacteraceae bacterium]